MLHTTFDGDDHDEQPSTAQTLARMIAQVDTQLQAIERASVRIADLHDKLRQAVSGRGQRGRRAPRLEDDERDQVAAQQGVRAFRMEWARGNRARVVIDGKQLELPPRLAELLALLASNQLGDSDDALVPWKSLALIAQQMSPKSPQKQAIHTASQNVCRLRQAMLESGINRYYVQSDRARGARLALRRDRAGL